MLITAISQLEDPFLSPTKTRASLPITPPYDQSRQILLNNIHPNLFEFSSFAFLLLFGYFFIHFLVILTCLIHFFILVIDFIFLLFVHFILLLFLSLYLSLLVLSSLSLSLILFVFFVFFQFINSRIQDIVQRTF